VGIRTEEAQSASGAAELVSHPALSIFLQRWIRMRINLERTQFIPLTLLRETPTLLKHRYASAFLRDLRVLPL